MPRKTQYVMNRPTDSENIRVVFDITNITFLEQAVHVCLYEIRTTGSNSYRRHRAVRTLQHYA